MQGIFNSKLPITLSNNELALYTFWHFASYTGNLPILENLSGGGLPSFFDFWQVAKISWHAAKGTPSDPPWPSMYPDLSPMTGLGPEKAYFQRFLTLTFDL